LQFHLHFAELFHLDLFNSAICSTLPALIFYFSQKVDFSQKVEKSTFFSQKVDFSLQTLANSPDFHKNYSDRGGYHAPNHCFVRLQFCVFEMNRLINAKSMRWLILKYIF